MDLSESVFSLTKEYDHQDFVVFMFNERSVSYLLSLNFCDAYFLSVNLLILSDFSKHSYYLNFINDSIQKYHNLNRNISLKYKNQLKLQNVRQVKINACHKLRNILEKNSPNVIPNCIFIKSTVDAFLIEDSTTLETSNADVLNCTLNNQHLSQNISLMDTYENSQQNFFLRGFHDIKQGSLKVCNVNVQSILNKIDDRIIYTTRKY